MNALLASILAPVLAGMLNTEPAPSTQFSVGVYPSVKAATLNVLIDNPAQQRVTVRLLNSHHQTLYQEMLGRKKEHYRARYDLTQLPNDVYTVEVSSQGKRIERQVDLNGSQTSLVPQTAELVSQR